MIDIMEHEGLAFKAAREAKKIYRYCEFDDLVQGAFLGLVMAAKKFDSSKGTKFSTLGYISAYRAAMREGRYSCAIFSGGWENGLKVKETMDKPISLEYTFEDGKKVQDVISIDNDTFEMVDIIVSANKHLNNNELDIFKNLFLEEKTAVEIARERGVTQQNLTRYKRSIKSKLNTFML